MSCDFVCSTPAARTLTAILIGVFAFILFLQGVDENPAFSDAAMYVNLARALQEGQGYVSTWILGDPPHSKFPPFLPLLLAPLVAYTGVNIIILKSGIAACGALGLAIMFYVMAQRHAGLALLATMGTVVSPHIRDFAALVLSEMPYIFFTALFFLAAQEWEKEVDERSYGRSSVMGLLLAVVVMTRLAGVALVIAVVIHLWRQIRTQRATIGQILVALGPTLIFFLWWGHRVMLFNTAHEGYLSYLKSFFEHRQLPFVVQMTQVWLHNIYAMVMYAVPEMVTGWRLSGPSISAVVVSFLTGLGLYASARSWRALLELYVACSVALVMCWPDANISGVRFLAPLTPLLLYYFGYGILHLGGWFVAGQRQQRLALVCMVMIMISQAASSTQFFQKGGGERREMTRIRPSFVMAMRWIREHTQPDAVLLPNPGLASALYLYSGRKSVLIAHEDFPNTIPTQQQVDALIHTQQIDYGVIIKGLFQTPISRALEQSLTKTFSVCLKNEYATVYDMRGAREIGDRR